MTAQQQVAAKAHLITRRLQDAERQCRDEYTNPHTRSASMPVVRELAEVVAALAELVASQTPPASTQGDETPIPAQGNAKEAQ